METATTRLLDLIRQAHGNCTDYRAGKLLGVSTSAISRWRVGAGHMSPALIIKACQLAGERDVFRWEMYIGAERERGPDGEFFRKVSKEFRALDQQEQPQKDWYLYPFIKGLGGLVPALLLACIGIAASSNSLAATVDYSTNSGTSLYIMRTRRRERRRIKRLLALIFPAWDSGTMEPLQLSAA